MTFSFGHDPASADAVTAVRGQFEQHLGRQLTPQEWKLLLDHARRHAETHMRG